MRRDAVPVNHFRMVIFDSPRVAAVVAHPNPVLLRGNGERFTGYGPNRARVAVGLRFEISWATTNSVATRWRIHPRTPGSSIRSGHTDKEDS